MYPGIELRVMRYFLAVAGELHFTRAAERVRVAQPSLSKQIRNLEEELGVELLKRSRRGVELTEPGRVFAENAEQALLYAERAAALARATAAGKSGRLLIGVSPAIDPWLYFRIRVAFIRLYPDVRMEPVTSSAIQLAEKLMRRDLHASLIELPIRYRGLSVMNVSREPIMLVISEKDVLASVKTIRAEEIHHRTLVLVSDEADLAHHKIINDLANWGFRPKKIQSVLTTSQVIDFVMAEQSIAAVRGCVARFRANGIAYRRIEGLPMLDTGIAYCRSLRTPPLRNLLRVIRQELLNVRR